MAKKSTFGKSQGVEICSSKLAHTGTISRHHIKGGNGAKKGKINGHAKGGKGY